VDEAIATYIHDVERLKTLEAEVAAFDPRRRARRCSAIRAAGGGRGRGGQGAGRGRAAARAVGRLPARRLCRRERQRGGAERGARRDRCARQEVQPARLVGKSGLGKTHLAERDRTRAQQEKGAIVACLSTQAFVDELIAAIDGNRVDWWRARYRRATALLLDDIHLLAGKDRTQEELFNLFNQLLDADRQLVFTAPAHPNTLQGWKSGSRRASREVSSPRSASPTARCAATPWSGS